MTTVFDPIKNHEQTKKQVGYVDIKKATPATYAALGFKSGLEVHQQLKTEKKLFCRCPVGFFQKHDDYDAEIIRHMRPTLSELGEYDGTALMEKKTRKNITYHIKYETACTYDVDDTPPFLMNHQALRYALEVSLLFGQNIVGEFHITRKQYLDGSIPTGFQRTGIVGIDGAFPIKNKTIRLIQLSIEEDSCREVSDIGHERVYTTDRLGTPLIETVTHPDMLTPSEVAEAAHYIRFVCRSTDHVRVGIGAARQDVNVSVTGGTRVEIKGVSQIKKIPILTHNEAFRQHALLLIKDELAHRIKDQNKWKCSSVELDYADLESEHELMTQCRAKKFKVVAVNLPHFKNLLSFFTQPKKCFATEISDRLKVIACLERPNMTHSEDTTPIFSHADWKHVCDRLKAESNDAQIVFWGPADDVTTALETIEERCRLAFAGVPGETRKALLDGTTIFERVLPGPDRMYPDTDSAPIPVDDDLLAEIKKTLPTLVQVQLKRLQEWKVPSDAIAYILRKNLMPILLRIVDECQQEPLFVATIFGHSLKHWEGQLEPSARFGFKKIYGLFKYVHEKNLHRDIIKAMLPVVYEHPNIVFDSVLETIGYQPVTKADIMACVPLLKSKFKEINTSKSPRAEGDWMMGQLRKMALGNVALSELRKALS